MTVLPNKTSGATGTIVPYPADVGCALSRMLIECGGADFQARFDKSTGHAQEMKERSLDRN